jgi:hypothetical protein
MDDVRGGRGREREKEREKHAVFIFGGKYIFALD